jgi:hypothetical protein
VDARVVYIDEYSCQWTPVTHSRGPHAGVLVRRATGKARRPSDRRRAHLRRLRCPGRRHPAQRGRLLTTRQLRSTPPVDRDIGAPERRGNAHICPTFRNEQNLGDQRNRQLTCGNMGAAYGNRTHDLRITRVTDNDHCPFHLRLCLQAIILQPAGVAAVDLISRHELCHARPMSGALRSRVVKGCPARCQRTLVS